MTKRIIILTDIGFSKRDYSRFGVEILSTKYKVEILDFTEWLSPKYWKVYPETIFNCEGYKKILNKEDFGNIVTENIINAIDFLSDSEKAYWVRNILKKKKIPITKIQNGFLETKRTFWEFLHKLFFLCFDPLKLFKKIIARFKDKFKNYKNSFSYDYLVLGGEVALDHILAKKAKKIIKSHSFDYDIFYKLKKKTITTKFEPYAVFLDQCLPFNPGPQIRGEKAIVTKDKYFPALNNFFSNFESKTGLKVIFAAHPRSRYDLYPEYLYGRKYLLNKTAELIINSKIVLLHSSTSLSFAVLYEKPMIFLTSDEIKRSFHDFRVHSYSRSMNGLLFNIDYKNNYTKIRNKDEFFLHDKNKYLEYKNKYLKFPGTSDKSLWYIFLDNIVDDS